MRSPKGRSDNAITALSFCHFGVLRNTSDSIHSNIHTLRSAARPTSLCHAPSFALPRVLYRSATRPPSLCRATFIAQSLPPILYPIKPQTYPQLSTLVLQLPTIALRTTIHLHRQKTLSQLQLCTFAHPLRTNYPPKQPSLC